MRTNNEVEVPFCADILAGRGGNALNFVGDFARTRENPGVTPAPSQNARAKGYTGPGRNNFLRYQPSTVIAPSSFPEMKVPWFDRIATLPTPFDSR